MYKDESSYTYRTVLYDTARMEIVVYAHGFVLVFARFIDKFLKSTCTNTNNCKDGKKEKNVYAYGGAGTYAIHSLQGMALIHSLRVGWRNFFPVVLLCQFFGFWWEIGFGVTYLHI